MSRKKGEGEGSLKDGSVWRGRWVQWIGDQQKRPETSFPAAKFTTKREARDELNRIIREASGRIGPLPQAPTFADIWQRYLALKKPHWVETADRHRRASHAAGGSPADRRA